MSNCQTFDLLDLMKLIIEYGEAMREQGRRLSPNFTVEEHYAACVETADKFDKINALIRKELMS